MQIEEYVETHGLRLLRFAYLVCGDKATAEDVVQDVLSSVVARWDKLAYVEDMDAYLRRAIVHRRNSRWRRRSRPDGVSASVEAQTSSHDEYAALKVDIWEACRRLPYRQRAAIVLRFYEDLQYDAIAEALDCPIGTAKSLVSRGLVALKPLLGEDHERMGQK